MDEQFKVGSTVKLKSGGPLMTVTDVGQSGMMGNGPIHVFTTWFAASGKRESDSFPPETLEIA